ncbi:MAG: hypothetical protein V8Q75_06570 [Bacilli bacterium]
MNKLIKVLRLFICSLLAIILCTLIIITHIVFDSSKFLKKDYIINALKEVDFIETNTNTSINTNNVEIKLIFDEVYTSANEIGINSSDVDKFINSDAVKEFMGSYMETITTYLATGEEINITKEELKKLTDYTVDDLLTKTDQKIDTETKKKIITIIDEQADQIISDLPKPSEIVTDIDQNTLKTINFIFSIELKIILIVSIVSITGLIALLLWHPFRFIKWFSISNTIASTFIIGLSFVISPIINWSLEGESSVILDIIISFINQFESSLLISGIIGLIISIILYVVYVLLKRKN